MTSPKNTSDRQQQVPGLHHNTVSYIGGLIMTAGLVLELALVIIQATVGKSPYIGIFSYLIFPFVILAGLLTVLYGMRRESLRRRRLGPSAGPAYPRIDLNDLTQRRHFRLVLAGSVLAGFLLVYVSYQGFLYTESVPFCGLVCHQVMKPQYTAYTHSPHARVPCVECHVGPGVPWYVKSKLSGVEQVFAVLFDTYPRPIRAPITELRPARDICEQCHWPRQFYGARLYRLPHFEYDKQNTSLETVLIVKTGGTAPNRLNEAGIHWHMTEGVRVEYRAADDERQQIPWCRVTRADGTVEEYVSRDASYSKGELDQMPRRIMDCMDCHNRPTHIFPPADRAVDDALANGAIPPDLPWIKKAAMDVLLASDPARQESGDRLREKIMALYKSKYPDIYANRREDLQKAATAVAQIRDRSVFPFMDVSWNTYPNNIGHLNWPGCFRCHDGRHATADNTVLQSDCTLCHTMPVRARLSPVGKGLRSGSDNWHGWELSGRHAKLLCHSCHRADWEPILDCAGCHGLDKEAPMMSSLSCGDCHTRDQEVNPLTACTECHEPAGLHTAGNHAAAGCTTCHQPHAWRITGRGICLQCHTDKKNHHAGEGACFQCHLFKG